MKKILIFISMLLILLTFICAKQAIGVYRTDKINETYDYLISRSIVTEKEKLFFENLDELIELRENSDFAEFTKVATFVAYGHYYSIRNNRNDHIIKIKGKDSIFNIRDEYVYE